jgi:uncharacterized protein
MPIQPTYPGVYVEEIPSGVHTIVGVSTSTTAFVGRALRGPDDRPYVINSFGDFERTFGGLWLDSSMSFAVRDFYLNGGGKAIIIRVSRNATQASIDLGSFKLKAKYVGAWGNRQRVRVDYKTRDPGDTKLFNLRIGLRQPTDPTNPNNPNDMTRPDIGEQFLNVSVDPKSTRFIGKVIAQSELVVIDGPDPTTRPAENTGPASAGDPLSGTDASAGPGGAFTITQKDAVDGDTIKDADLFGQEVDKSGIHRLLPSSGTRRRRRRDQRLAAGREVLPRPSRDAARRPALGLEFREPRR